MFGRSKQNDDIPPEKPSSDRIFNDLPRGVERRPHHENHRPHQYFETAEELAKIGFRDHSGDNFLGIIGGTTEQIEYENGFKEWKTTGGIPVGSIDDRHRTLVAGSRSGKGRSVIVPELLTYAGSMIVIDPKGENAGITANYRADELGQKVFIIDPFQVTPKHCLDYRKRCFGRICRSKRRILDGERQGFY